jgi:hypothetical protein
MNALLYSNEILFMDMEIGISFHFYVLESNYTLTEEQPGLKTGP